MANQPRPYTPPRMPDPSVVISGNIVSVSLYDERRNPRNGIVVVFWQGGVKKEERTVNGFAEFAGKPGKVHVQVAGFPSIEKMIEKPAAPAKPAANDKLAISASGKKGNYIVSAVVSSVDNQPRDGATVVFLADGKKYEIPTNSGGIASQEIVFLSKTLEVIVQTAGAVEPQKLHLLGPDEAPIPPASQITNWWDGIKKGIRAGLEARNEMKRRN